MCILKINRWGRIIPGIAALALVASTAWPCGIDWPKRILTATERELRGAPEASFHEEIERIKAEYKPTEVLPLYPSAQTDTFLGGKETTAIDIDDVSSSLSSNIGDVTNRRELLNQYKAIRCKLSSYVQKKQPRWAEEIPIQDATEAELRNAVIPEGIPVEFAEYLRGAIAFHLGDTEEARKHWLAILDLPADQRMSRTIWAAFMLGRSWRKEDPSQAIGWFRKVRAWQGDFNQTLDFSTASVGWEAYAELQRRNFIRAFELYMIEYQAGVDSCLSLKFTARQLVDSGSPEALRKAAEDPLAQSIVTAYLISRPYESGGGFRTSWFQQASGFTSIEQDSPDYSLQARQWLEALEKVPLSKIKGADRLALSAYQAGAMKICTRWLELADPGSSLTQWLQAKMLMRDGVVDEAERILTKLAPSRRPERFWRDRASFFNDNFFNLPASDRVWGELGILHLDNGDFTEALDAILRGHYWGDAAYLAERVVSVKELRDYVDKEWPESSDPLSQRIRYLLGRRLVREGVFNRTNEYFPDEMKSFVTQYADSLYTAKDIRKTSTVRAKAYMTAARIAHCHGMELMGTEVEPDWAIFEGNYEPEPASKVRTGVVSIENLVDSEEIPNVRGSGIDVTRFFNPAKREEEKRVRQSAPYPDLRCHYRYAAAALGWEASKLLPDNSDETARVLWECGSWLKVRAPLYSDRFYKALVNRCPNTPLGQAADKRRWFPPADERGNPILTKSVMSNQGVEENLVIPTPVPASAWLSLPWHFELASATAEARSQKKMIYLGLSTEDCPWCRKLEEDTYSNPMVAEALKNQFVLCYIKTKWFPEVVQRYKPDGYPALLVLDATGQVLLSNSGYLDPEGFTQIFLASAKYLPLIMEFEKPGTANDADKFRAVAAELKAALPTNPDILNEMAWEWIIKDKKWFKSAVVAAAKAVELASNDLDIVDTLARAELAANHFDGAVDLFRRLKASDYDGASLTLAWALAVRGKEGDAGEAIQVLKEYFEKMFQTTSK